MATWSDNEVLQLINFWGEEGVEEQLEGAKRNKHIYEKISKALAKNGIHKSGDQCRAKMKKLKMDYCNVKDKNGKTGRGRSIWKYFAALDAIMGHRPATKPPVLLDTAAEQLVASSAVDDVSEEDELEETIADDGSSASTSTTESDCKQLQSQNSTASMGIKGRCRKRTVEEKMESVMKKLVKDVDAQHKSHEMFLMMEEKRMKFEADQRKQEKEFQLQMMSMIFGRHGPHTPPAARPAYSPQATTNSFDPCGQFQGYN